MCDFKKLEHDEYGYATQCFECNHIEIAFGTSLIRFPFDKIGAFVKYLKSVKRSAKVDDRSQKKIVLDLASMYSFQMIMSYDEMLLFCERAERVEDEVKANVLLGLFNN